MTSNLIFTPPYIAHRGLSVRAPENTLAAFLKAKQAGFQWVEFDVRLSAEGDVMVFHDEALSRTTNGQGLIGGMHCSDLKTLDAGSWFSEKFVGERIPTFSETLLFLYQHQLSANIEIKNGLREEAMIAKKVWEIIQTVWPGDLGHLLVSSFSYPVLQYSRKKSPTVQLAFLMDEWDDEWKKKCDAIHAMSVHLNQSILTKERAAAIKSTGRFLLVYTINMRKRAEELFSWGVDAVFTDDAIF